MNTTQRIAIVGSSPVIPDGMCCNCGTTSSVKPTSSKLVWATAVIIPGMAAAGQELRLTLDLPYCPECADTAGRIAPTMGKKFWVWFLWLWYSRRKPTGSRTSFYQAVRLVKPEQKFFGKTKRLVFAFSNGAYAEQFLNANLGAEKL